MLGVGRKRDQDIRCDAVFVDLSKEEIPGDVTAQRVKVIKIRNAADVDVLPKILSSECTLIVNLEDFDGDASVSIDRMKAMARTSRFEYQSINPMTFIFTPANVKMTNLVIR